MREAYIEVKVPRTNGDINTERYRCLCETVKTQILKSYRCQCETLETSKLGAIGVNMKLYDTKFKMFTIYTQYKT